MRRVDFEVDRLTRDALVVTGHTRRLVLDFALDIAKVGEAAVGDVVELGPFAGARNVCVPVRRVGGGGRFGVFVRDIDEL